VYCELCLGFDHGNNMGTFIKTILAALTLSAAVCLAQQGPWDPENWNRHPVFKDHIWVNLKWIVQYDKDTGFVHQATIWIYSPTLWEKEPYQNIRFDCIRNEVNTTNSDRLKRFKIDPGNLVFWPTRIMICSR
jgi:hypothetical protein